MNYTNMTFGDLLVADIGALPKHTRINEDIYDLLTLPYTFGSGVRTRLLSARMPRNDEGSRYSLTTFITKGDVEATLKTKLTVAGREARDAARIRVMEELASYKQKDIELQ